MFGVEQRVWLRYFLQWKVPLTSFQVKGKRVFAIEIS